MVTHARADDIYQVTRSTKFTHRLKALLRFRNSWLYAYTAESWSDAQNELGDSGEVPGGCAGLPRVFGFAVRWSVSASFQLGTDMRFAAVRLAVLFADGWTNSGVIIKSAVPSAKLGFGYHYPGVVVTKNTGVFLISRWICGYFHPNSGGIGYIRARKPICRAGSPGAPRQNPEPLWTCLFTSPNLPSRTSPVFR